MAFFGHEPRRAGVDWEVAGAQCQGGCPVRRPSGVRRRLHGRAFGGRGVGIVVGNGYDVVASSSQFLESGGHATSNSVAGIVRAIRIATVVVCDNVLGPAYQLAVLG